MKNIWTIADIDPRKLFEVVTNRDPETAARFSLPIPNWLDATNNSRYDHPDIKWVEKKKRTCFTFHNYEDNSEQYAKIDGEGVIFFTSPTPGQVLVLRKIISEYATDLSSLTPSEIKEILGRSYSEIGLIDRYHGSRTDIAKMDIIGDVEADPAFGNFVYKPVVSTCVYIEADGEFHGGPTIQTFEKSGFIVFPGQSIKNVKPLIKSYDPENPVADHNVNVRVVSKAMFLKSRRMPDHKPIAIDAIPVQKIRLRKFYKPKPIGGFPEWVPEVRDIERQWLNAIAEIFEVHGFVNIETPAVEEITVLAAKGGDIDKEVYALHRGVTKQEKEQAGHEGELAKQENLNEPRIALHYDLTVPLARYVAQHFDKLTFPFKRYQIQKVWRGDRPQKGRYREFVQCDIDVVDQGGISLEFDAEFPMIVHALVEKLDIGNVVIGISNRKILQGFYQGLGIEDDQIIQAIRALDKIDRDGKEGVRTDLSEEVKLPEEVIDKCIALATIRETESSVTEKVLALGVDTPLLREGLKELDFVMERLHSLPKGSVVADLSIARGFDYYTGTVYEGRFVDYPDFPVILAGGRYDNLVSNFMNRSLPGVGISFGLTRVFAKLVQENRLPAGRKTPTQALVVVPDIAARDVARSIVDNLRERGIPAEVYHEPARLSKQLEYADRKDIPFVIIPDMDSPNTPQVKDMRTGSQGRVSSIQTWAPGG